MEPEILPKKQNIGELLKENLQKIIIIVVSVVYITYGIFALVNKDANVLEIVGSIILSVIVGVIISSSLNSMGLKDGRRSEQFKSSMEVYGEAKTNATPYFDKIAYWCMYKNARDLELKKKNIIQRAGLNWKAFKFGYYDNHTNRLTDKQKTALLEAKNAKIQELESDELLSDLPMHRKSDGRFGESVQAYMARASIMDWVTRIGLGVVSGMYSLSPLITAENAKQMIAGIIWNTLQIAMWITMGFLKYESAKSFIIDEYRQTHIIQKTEYLNEFIVTMKNNPEVIKEYDEQDEINKYIDEYIKEKKGELQYGN